MQGYSFPFTINTDNPLQPCNERSNGTTSHVPKANQKKKTHTKKKYYAQSGVSSTNSMYPPPPRR
jgi:hypothetical protein